MILAAPAPEVSFLDTISIGEVVIGLSGLLVILTTLRKVWPILRRLAVLADAADWLPEVRRQLQTIHHELTPNDGGSIKDAVARLEHHARANSSRIDSLGRRLDAHIDKDSHP